MRGAIAAILVFLRSELLSWAFWKTLGIPAVTTLLYALVAVLSGQYGPLIVLGTCGTFALAMVARAAWAQAEYVETARQVMKTGRGVPPLIVPTRKILRKGRIPQITVTKRGVDNEAVLLVENTGGDGEFVADGRIITVDPPTLFPDGKYRMRWRETTSHRMVDTHELVIPADGNAKLVLAHHESGGDWGKPSLVIVGDKGSVFRTVHDPYERPSATVTLEVAIRATPALTTHFKRRYQVFIPRKTFTVATLDDDIKQ